MGKLSVFETDCVVVGAGVIGLAIAKELSLSGKDVVIIERNSMIGMETSSRNSEVIHAGIYYPMGSQKAICCVQGKSLLYSYLEQRKLDYKRCGKIIVANNEVELSELENINKKAMANGVHDLEFLTGRQCQEMEPALRVKGGLLSPSTGIIDSHGYMVALLGDAENAGANIVFETNVVSGRIRADGRTSLICDGQDPCELIATMVINSTGLHAPEFAAKMEGFPPSCVPNAYYAKGNYFTLTSRPPFSRLIYPVPEKAGLGVHLTLDMGGQARFGPDVEWIDSVEYEVDPKRGEKFYAAIRKYWPDLPDDSLQPAYAGIRPKIVSANQPNADFEILGPERHGIEGQIHLFGIESPGLTASLAIAQSVRQLIS